jgi:prephenate dehydratase
MAQGQTIEDIVEVHSHRWHCCNVWTSLKYPKIKLVEDKDTAKQLVEIQEKQLKGCGNC